VIYASTIVNASLGIPAWIINANAFPEHLGKTAKYKSLRAALSGITLATKPVESMKSKHLIKQLCKYFAVNSTQQVSFLKLISIFQADIKV